MTWKLKLVVNQKHWWQFCISYHSGLGPAEELEDGFKLLRKSDDDNYVSCSAKHTAKKQKRSRKASMAKRITHTPEVLEQFSKFSLSAPTTMAEILTVLQTLRTKKVRFIFL